MPTDGRLCQALAMTQDMQRCAINAGFSWPDVGGAFEKVREELSEVEKALAEGGCRDVDIEVGDLLFAVTCLATYLDRDADQELRAATDRFQERYHKTCKLLQGYGKSLKECSQAELAHAWRASR